MTADFNIEIEFTGSIEEMEKCADILEKYTHTNAYTDFPTIFLNKKSILSTLSDEGFMIGFHCQKDLRPYLNKAINKTIYITCSGPYGRYDSLSEFEMFNNLAKECPNAIFSAFIRGFRGSLEEGADYEFKNKQMTAQFYGYDTEDMQEEFATEFKKYIPYSKFCEIFKVRTDEFDEEDFSGFIWQTCNCCGTFDEIEFDDISEISDITEEDFDAAKKQFIDALKMKSPDEYRDEYSQYNEEYRLDTETGVTQNIKINN